MKHVSKILSWVGAVSTAALSSLAATGPVNRYVLATLTGVSILAHLKGEQVIKSKAKAP
jgi:hypothetical protein